MFFFGIMGIGSGAKPAGEVSVVCPLCGGQIMMNVARSYSYFHFFFIPLFSLVCSTLPPAPTVPAYLPLIKRWEMK